MKTARIFHLPPRLILLAAVLSSFCLIAEAQEDKDKNGKRLPPHTIVVKDFFGNDRMIHDADGDGWDDLWTSTHREIKHRDRITDTDGDGLTDYEEMVLWRNPFVKGPLPRALTQEEIAEGERKAAATLAAAKQAWERKLAELSPRLLPIVPPGQPEPEAKILQEEERAAALRRDAQASRLAQPAKERELDDIARKYDVRREYVDEDGRKLLLSGEMLGPVFIQSHDTLSAAGIGADELWPVQNNPSLPGYWPYAESHTGLNLTGAGQTLGMWEVDGGVRTTHIELGSSRVFQKDAISPPIAHHATSVAGTMAGGGAGLINLNPDVPASPPYRQSRGAAYQADVFAYDLTNFIIERTDAAAGVNDDPPLRLSNHSWGATCGWRQEDIDPTVGVNIQWVWYGPDLANFQEDHKFGLYTWDMQNGSGCAQIDHFHHAQAPQHLMIYACGNDRGEGPGPITPPETYYYRIGETSWVSVDAEDFPRDWDDGDEGGYDTLAPPGTAKNVLTVGACEDVFHLSGSDFIPGFGPGTNAVPAPFSGAGPTDDGRIKPDLVAVGTIHFDVRKAFGLTSGSTAYLLAPIANADTQYTGAAVGTSFAAPTVTGALGLVLERREELYSGAQAWRGSTLKAIAINTCDDVGAEGPDYNRGHGIMNARSAALAVDADHGYGRGSLIKEFNLDPSASVSWVVRSDGEGPLAVTAAWSDPPGPAPTPQDILSSGPDPQNPMLVNNLDLKVEYLGTDTQTVPPPSAPLATYLPWVLDPDLTNRSAAVRAQAATRGVDNRNNVEKVSIAAPAAGRYRITVTHSGGLSGNPAPSAQVVSLALGGVEPELPHIEALEASPTADEFLLTFTADPGAWFTIEGSPDLQTWTDVGSVLAESDTNTIVVTSTGSEPHRFWRLRRGQ